MAVRATGTKARRDSLVVISQSVFVPAAFALRGGFGVVHQVMHWFESVQIREHRLQVIVRHVAIGPPRHDRVQLAGANITGAYSLDEQFLVVVADAGVIRGEISGSTLRASPVIGTPPASSIPGIG